MGIKKKKSKLKIKRKESSDSSLMTLPKKKTKPCQSLFEYVTLLFGLKKIGKTSMLSELGDGLFVPFESGTKALKVFQPLKKNGERKILSGNKKGWDDFRALVKLVCKDKTFPFVVIDPIDKAFKAATKWCCDNLGIDHVSEADWGKGYEAVREEFTEQIDKLLACGKGVFFVSHATEKKITSRTGDSWDLITSTMPNAAREIVEGVVDIWAYYQYDGDKRVLTIRGDDCIGAGHRLKDNFRYTDGKRIRHINMGRSEKESAQNFISAFNNEIENPKKKGGKKKKVKFGKKK